MKTCDKCKMIVKPKNSMTIKKDPKEDRKYICIKCCLIMITQRLSYIEITLSKMLDSHKNLIIPARQKVKLK